jgi:RNA polymerase sigma-70 factor (ECF subfamily)
MPLDHDNCLRLLIRERVKLIGYIRAIVGDVHTAEDVFQQVSVLVLKKLNEIQDADHFMGWMRRAARLEALNAARKSDRQPLTLDNSVAELLAPQWQRYDAVESSDLIEALRACLVKLTPNARQLVEMRYHDDLTSSQIAEKLSRKTATVYQAISRAHQALAECVRDQSDSTGEVRHA